MESVFAAPQLLLLRPQIPISTHALKLSAAAQSQSQSQSQSQWPFDFRFKRSALKLQIRERWQAVSASKSNPPDGDSIKDKSGGVKRDDVPQGPPFLTILAGLLVLLLVFWIIGSILMWLISLFVSLPRPK